MVTGNDTGSPWPQRRPARTRADERYELIYETAARLFHEKGYATTSLQDLASAVGLKKGSLYHYIDSKEDLLFGIVEYAHKFFLAVLNETDNPQQSATQKIREMMRAHALFAAEHFHITAAFYTDRSALSRERQERVVQTRDAYEAKLRQLITWGQREGELAGDIDPKLATLGLLGMINSIHQWYRPDGLTNPQTLADEFSVLCIRALSPSATETH